MDKEAKQLAKEDPNEGLASTHENSIHQAGRTITRLVLFRLFIDINHSGELHVRPVYDCFAFELGRAPGPATYSSCHVDGPYIVMTFDDGPSPVTTTQLLDILEKRGIKITDQSELLVRNCGATMIARAARSLNCYVSYDRFVKP